MKTKKKKDKGSGYKVQDTRDTGTECGVRKADTGYRVWGADKENR